MTIAANVSALMRRCWFRPFGGLNDKNMRRNMPAAEADLTIAIFVSAKRELQALIALIRDSHLKHPPLHRSPSGAAAKWRPMLSISIVVRLAKSLGVIRVGAALDRTRLVALYARA